MTTTPRPMCVSCLWLHPTENTCQAFPDGIPNPILLSEVDHRVPVEGDRGIQFEQDPDVETLDAALMDALFRR